MRRAVVGLALVVCACGGDARPDLGALAEQVGTRTAGKGAHVTFELAGGTRGEGDYRVAPDLAAEFHLTGISGPTQFVLLDKVIYLRSDPNAGWHRYAAGTVKLADSLVEQANLGRQLDRMRSAGTITATTAETVDGVRTTRYAIDVDLAKLIEAEPDEVLKGTLRALAQQGVTRMPYQLWLDGQNLPVKITTSLAGKVNTVHYSRWGEPVRVSAPPPDQVTGT
jgi:hypothetical protein